MKSLILLTTLLTMNFCSENNNLNERWVFSDTQSMQEEWGDGQAIPKNEHLEIEFLSDGTFKYKGKHSNRWDSYATGTYHCQKATGEIFVYVEHGGFDWISQQRSEEIPELYYTQFYSNYQLYFKIAERNDSTITVVEYINSYQEDIPESSDYYNTSPIWEEKDGEYRLIATDQNRMKQREYRSSSLEDDEPSSVE